MVVYAAGNIVHDESVYPKNKNKNYITIEFNMENNEIPKWQFSIVH